MFYVDWMDGLNFVLNIVVVALVVYLVREAERK